jgi:LCP family protein required for cell wall assembly
LTPEEPEFEQALDADDARAGPRSRSDLQAELRGARKKEHKRRHRWRRRLLFALAAVVLLAALGAGGLYEYVNYRYDQIKKIHSRHLVSQAPSGRPFTLLLVGSDSRQFVRNATQANAFGSQTTNGGERSDVTMLARFVPATKTVTILSVPRDLWVEIPGTSSVAGENRINAAYDSGPDLLIRTIEQDLGVPINHYVAVDFPGFSGMVDSLGGITMDFPTQVKDQLSGLHVTTTGCQVVDGTTALELVRSRHLYYMQNGYWNYDGQSDFSRIQRQDSFFRAVLDKLNSVSLNPLTINAFIGSAVGNLTIDDTLSKGDLFDIATQFRGLPSSHLVTETLPTTEFTTAGGASVLKMAQPYAFEMLETFRQLGTKPPKPAHTPPTTTTTTAPIQAQGGAAPATTTTTTIPADVVTNTQPEPWNPYPCTLGQSTQASPHTATTPKGATTTSKK